MQLKHLTDKALIQDTKFYVSKERELTTKILHHLLEIDKRKLYSDYGYSSLFTYAVKELGYSEASAHRRILSARLLGELPELEEKLESGVLSLTNLGQAHSYFRENQISSNKDKMSIIKEVENLSKKDCEQKLFKMSGKEIPAKESSKRISESSHKVTVILTDETLKKLEYLKDLMGENPSMEELINLMADHAIKQKEKQKFKLVKKEPTKLPPVKVGRSISSSTKRQVYLRDKVCTKCGSKHLLNFDHKHPYSLGGSSTPENIRLLCTNCNQRGRIRAKLTY